MSNFTFIVKWNRSVLLLCSIVLKVVYMEIVCWITARYIPETLLKGKRSKRILYNYFYEAGPFSTQKSITHLHNMNDLSRQCQIEFARLKQFNSFNPIVSI